MEGLFSRMYCKDIHNGGFSVKYPGNDNPVLSLQPTFIFVFSASLATNHNFLAAYPKYIWTY